LPDGKVDAPMLPDLPALMKSLSEGTLFWREDVELVDKIPTNSATTTECEKSVKPKQAAVTCGLGTTKDHLLYLRKRWLWAANDNIRRVGEASPSFWSPSLVGNIEELLALLTLETVPQRLFAAELNRNLGRFDEALDMLSQPVDEKYEHTVQQMRGWTTAGKRAVQEVKDSETDRWAYLHEEAPPSRWRQATDRLFGLESVKGPSRREPILIDNCSASKRPVEWD
jgi:hypothetical protein